MSIEVDPRLAHNTQATIAEARALWWAVDRPNMFVKIPAARQGLPAIAACLAEGISINVTLIFSLTRYDQVMDAYLDGMERAHQAGLRLDRIGSVASFFVSRVDSEVDARLDKLGGGAAAELRGQAAIANARLAYQHYEKVFTSARWDALRAASAHPQRPLWASTSTKDPAYPDTRYVVDLVAPGVVNTMPEPTLRAVADHGVVPADSVRPHYGQAAEVLDSLERLGISYAEVTAQLEREGVDKFEKAWGELLDGVTARARERPRREHWLAVAATGAAADAVATHVPTLVADRVASRLFAQDHTLWGEAAEAEAAKRLSWAGLPRTSRHLVGEIAAMRDELAATGLRPGGAVRHGRLVAGPRGHLRRRPGCRIVVLDSSDPDVVRGALSRPRPHRGRRLEQVRLHGRDRQPAAGLRAGASRDAGIDPTSRMVIVTDPGSPLEEAAPVTARLPRDARRPERGRTVQRALHRVRPSAHRAGGRGRDPAARRGPIASASVLALQISIPGSRWAPRSAATPWPGTTRPCWPTAAPGFAGFGDWAEQLIAESTGKDGRGIACPVVVEDEGRAGLLARSRRAADRTGRPRPGPWIFSP